MKRPNFNDRLFTGLILLTTSLLVNFSGELGRVDNLLYDLGQRLHSDSTPSDMVIVAIDEESLSKLGRWPWSRHQHAKLINRLKNDGARVIGMDLIFAEPDTIDPSSDKALSEAIHHAGNVVLPVLMESNRVNGQLIETLPLPTFSNHAATMGSVHVELDEDGIGRSVYLWEGLGIPAWPTFAQAILQAANIKPPHLSTTAPEQSEQDFKPFTLTRKDQRRVSFLGKPGSVQSLSYVQVLNGEFPSGLFKDKIVLVGATASGMGDFIPTPVSGLHQPMSGVEFHASVIDSMRYDRLVYQVPHWVTVLISTLLAISPILWLPRLAPLQGLLISTLWFTSVAGISMLLPSLLGVWLPPSAALLAIALAYPIWSWRKLASAQRFLDYSLQLLHQDAAWIERRIDKNRKVDHKDNMQSRIAQVQTASQRLRQLHEDRLETLAFISHDLRAPLIAAIFHMESSADHLRTPLERALKLAEDFLQVSRAEMMDASRWQEIDLTAVLHQVMDDAHLAAREKSIQLVREIPHEPVWLQGDFTLLHRAVLNLVLNAVKFSPADAAVTLALNVSPQLAIVSVTDHGPGISADQKERLFQRFSQAGSNAAMPKGAGLGLYFVRTVAVKHGGNVDVLSEQGSFTRFTIQLPLAFHSNP
ncbi:MAG: CHASE2 domain-containing protein [Methylotenera sp.]|nr:CHASE2 domain-containing protein [Methylotenera sp.]MDO9389788.1 CHASE2 domain-containing protein [Methylotenera sp.]MDP1595885.1 CHASE2 domain-containing protein [Methylotenera sp.]MDP1755126.1 CHASE2 domain-containing protein [Methylotenera sp.]MDP1958292.1 CHASE2 domain-containing protein [Methylotenera sp.]